MYNFNKIMILKLIAFENEQEADRNQQEKRKSAGQVLPITVLRSQMSKKQKSAGKAKISRTSLAYYRFA